MYWSSVYFLICFFSIDNGGWSLVFWKFSNCWGKTRFELGNLPSNPDKLDWVGPFVFNLSLVYCVFRLKYDVCRLSLLCRLNLPCLQTCVDLIYCVFKLKYDVCRLGLSCVLEFCFLSNLVCIVLLEYNFCVFFRLKQDMCST